MPTVHVKNDYLPDDAEIIVPGIGLFKNGETREIDDITVANFKAAVPGVEFPENGHLEVLTPTREQKEQEAKLYEDTRVATNEPVDTPPVGETPEGTALTQTDEGGA